MPKKLWVALCLFVSLAAFAQSPPESASQKSYTQARTGAQTLRWLGEPQYEGRARQVISFADIDGAQVALYFDDQTKLLTKRETLGDDPVLGVIANETVYSDWRPVGNLTLPYRYTDKVASREDESIS